MKFYKYQGAGNDFVLIDNRDNNFNAEDTALVAHLCDRRFGIGADGLMLLQEKGGYDFEMLYYNADGNLGSMCGNGGRCIVAFAKHLGIIQTKTTFLAVDGAHEATINQEADWVSLKMIDVSQIRKDGDAYVLNTGSPHYIKTVKNLQQFPVVEEGRAIRYHPTYKEDGINVNFVEAIDKGYAVRTYERGVEDETLACGTGVTAVALAMAYVSNQTGILNTPIKAQGGALNIQFHHQGDGIFHEIYLEGPAHLVFEGDIN
ncbi:diaminopimelate epimerase [Olivibacter sp. SDN3]|nr:diaminopimelate epimerase [Olivibacter sp. SDN3]